MPRILTSATILETGKLWTSTESGSFLQAPITEASCLRNMKVKRIPRLAYPSWSTKSKLFAGNIPQCDRGVKVMLNRQNFIYQVSGSVAALAGSSMLPSGRVLGANDRVRFGLIGAGGR